MISRIDADPDNHLWEIAIISFFLELGLFIPE